jgi:hypothetical protein
MLWQVACGSPCFDAKAFEADIRSAMIMQAKVEIRQYNDDDEMEAAALADFNH